MCFSGPPHVDGRKETRHSALTPPRARGRRGRRRSLARPTPRLGAELRSELQPVAELQPEQPELQPATEPRRRDCLGRPVAERERLRLQPATLAAWPGRHTSWL